MNQDDHPWWFAAILSWISMVKFIGECPGKRGDGFRLELKYLIEGSHPEELAKLYESYQLYLPTIASEYQK